MSCADLAISVDGGQITVHGKGGRVREVLLPAELDEKVGPHWLRHAHATHALARGCPVHLVQETLGHSSISVTGRYLHARLDDSRATYSGQGTREMRDRPCLCVTSDRQN